MCHGHLCFIGPFCGVEWHNIAVVFQENMENILPGLWVCVADVSHGRTGKGWVGTYRTANNVIVAPADPMDGRAHMYVI